MKETFKAVLFDLDGTLLNTIDDLADSMNTVLDRMGFPPHDIEKYKYFVGDGIDVLAQRVLPEKNRDKKTIERCISEMRTEYSGRWADKTQPYEGISELLDSLVAKGILLNILSNKPDPFTQKNVEHFLGRWNFTCVLGASEDFPKKPDPAGAIRIATILGLKPEKFLYLGDTNTDMLTAVSAGMYPVGAAWGFRTVSELKKYGARAIITRPMDLLEI